MNIELMEEIRKIKPKPKQELPFKAKRSRRAIAWLVRELDDAIEHEMNNFIDKYIIIKMRNGDYTTLYGHALRLKPAYDILKVKNPDIARALETIFDMKENNGNK